MWSPYQYIMVIAPLFQHRAAVRIDRPRLARRHQRRRCWRLRTGALDPHQGGTWRQQILCRGLPMFEDAEKVS